MNQTMQRATDNLMRVDLRRVPWTALVSAAGLAVTGLLAWDDVRDATVANAAELTQQQQDHATSMAAIWAQLDRLRDQLDMTDEEFNQMQQRLIQQSGDQKQAVSEIRGDVKLILRLLEERDN